MSASLRVEDLTVRWGKAIAVDGVSFDVPAGTTTAVLGRNGAGKSSVLAGIMGLASRSSGAVIVDGVARRSGRSLAHAGVAIVLERRELFAHMSVEDNLILGGYVTKSLRLRNVREGERMSFVLGMFPRLEERRSQLAGTLSGGEQQMLAIGRALMSSPRILILDEPSIGLAPLIVDQIYANLEDLKRSGLTLVLVEEHPIRAMGLADDVVVLDRGQIVLHRSGDEVRALPSLLEASYLAREVG